MGRKPASRKCPGRMLYASQIKDRHLAEQQLSLRWRPFYTRGGLTLTDFGPSSAARTHGLLVPNQARYQLRYTRIFTFLHDTTENGKNKVFSVCGHLCGLSRFYGTFGNRGKSCKRRCRKALRRFASPYPGYNHGAPKASALPTALIPDFGVFSFAPDVVKHVVRRFF